MSRSIANIEVDANKFNSTNETENLHLPQFIATDKPSWLGDFNGSMEVIDEAAEVLQEQITEQFEDLEEMHEQLNRVDDDVNNPETGVRQVLHDTQTRVTDLETVVGDEQHGLVKDVHELQEDMIQTNTMAVKSNAQLGSIINLLCNKYSNAAQYSQGAYVYTENEDGSLNFLRCTSTTHGAFNPDKWEDVTEKLISALDSSGGGGGSQYVLPVASDADDPDPVLGGIIVGEGLSIDPETGILSRTVTPTEGIGPDYYASQVRAGLVRPNTEAGLNVNSSNGVISVIIDDSTMEFTNDGRLKAKPDTSRFAQGQGISLSSENVPSISVRLAAENSNLGFDGNGGLRAILPASAYEIVQGDGITITTDPQTNTKTVSMVQASTNTLGGVRPKSDSFAFESYDQEHPELKKMTIQLKDKGGLQKQDGVGLSVKVDGTSVQIDQTTGELKAPGSSQYELPIASANTLGGIKVGQNLSIDPVTGVLDATGGGSGADYNPGDNSVEVNNVSHTIKVKKKTDGGLDVDTNGIYVKTGQGIVKTDGSLVVPKVGDTLNGTRQTSGTISSTGLNGSYYDNFENTAPGQFTKLIDSGTEALLEEQGYINLSSQVSYNVAGSATPKTYKWYHNPPQVEEVGGVMTLTGGQTYHVGDKVYQFGSESQISEGAKAVYPNTQLPCDIIRLQCLKDFDSKLMYKIEYNAQTNRYEAVLDDTVNLQEYFGTMEFGPTSGLFNDKASAIIFHRRYAGLNTSQENPTKLVPFYDVMHTGDLHENELMPIGSTVVGQDPTIVLPQDSNTAALRRPYAFLYPLAFKINTNELANKSFSGKLCTIIYYVDVTTVDRRPVMTLDVKRINIDSSWLDNIPLNGVAQIREKIAYDSTNGGEYGNKMGMAFIYPQSLPYVTVRAQLEVVNLSTGDIERYYSTSMGNGTNTHTAPFELYGASYLYDLSTSYYTDGDVYVPNN